MADAARYAGTTLAALIAVTTQLASTANASDLSGQDAYTTYCIGCHQFDGMGIASVYPALGASQLVNGDAKLLARLILDGGFANTTMPKFRDVLNDATAAALLTYIRSNWNNEAAPVSARDIAARASE